ncbi:MAG TPA: class I SAM-dependent methyltransferase [Candidatus Baltobacteraceae bacterium]|nr:class I SAM-dependent methyltransferase [Candidatus Baltobacteraceae bacterium]
MIDPQLPAAPEIKQCCAALYGSNAARFLLGESFHPGGVELTLELAGMLHLDAAATVLDVASGKGASAFAVAERFGCQVVGIDLSEANVAESNAEALRRGLSRGVRFVAGDAESLPFSAASFDALLCECAFCTFPDKHASAAEFARVLRPGGWIGMSDLTRAAVPLPELDGLLAWIACIADAQPLERYAQWLAEAGFNVTAAVTRDRALETMVEEVRGKLLLADIMIGLNTLELPGLDLERAKQFAAAAGQAVKDKKLGYAFLVAESRRH